MTDQQGPIVPRLEDLYPAVGDPRQDPPGWPRVVPAGEDLSTIKHDHTPGIRDVRTPPEWIPVEKILAAQMGITTDGLRLVRGYMMDFGAVTMWEVLSPGGDVVEYAIASYVHGADRLRLVSARTMTLAEGRMADVRAHLGDLVGPDPLWRGSGHGE